MDKKDRERIEKTTMHYKENRPKKALISLGGTAITEEGKLTRSNYFRFLGHDLDKYDEIWMTPKQARKLHNHLTKLSTGSTAMTPMHCAGALCPVADRCPLVQMKHAENEEERGHPTHGKAPVGKQCIIEVQLIKEWIVRYFEEFDIDPNNFTEVGYVNELADLMVMEMRINMNLAKVENSALVVENTIGVDRDGDPILQKAISPYIEMKDRIANRRSKIIKLMVGDRQEKYKREAALKVKTDADTSQQMSNMRSQLDGLKRLMDNMSKGATEAGEKIVSGALSPDDLIASDDE
jgi:hypothetical protein